MNPFDFTLKAAQATKQIRTAIDLVIAKELSSHALSVKNIATIASEAHSRRVTAAASIMERFIATSPKVSDIHGLAIGLPKFDGAVSFLATPAKFGIALSPEKLIPQMPRIHDSIWLVHQAAMAMSNTSAYEIMNRVIRPEFFIPEEKIEFHVPTCKSEPKLVGIDKKIREYTTRNKIGF